MPTMKMTARAIRELPAPDPTGKQTLYWAEGTATPNLGILVSGISPSKSWVVQANLPSGKTRRVTIGPVSVFSIEEAWEEAKPKLAAILRGNDPKQTLAQRQIAGMTVSDVLNDYLGANSNLRPATIKLYRSAAKHLGPLLNRSLREITFDDVERQFRAITRDVSERRERGEIRGGVNVAGKAIANCAVRLFGSLWEFQAERDNGLADNPVRGRRFKKHWHNLESRKNRRIPAERLGEFYKAARHLQSDIQRDLVLFGLFTGMREKEAAGLRWEEVDLVNRKLHLPEGRMKGKKDFDLPMCDLVYQILVARRAIGREGPFVFPGYGKSGHCESFTYALGQIGQTMGINPLSPHDLRRTFLDVVENSEISPFAHKLLVAHSTGGDVTNSYKDLSLADFRAAAQKVADRFKQLCDIQAPAGENVRQIATS